MYKDNELKDNRRSHKIFAKIGRCTKNRRFKNSPIAKQIKFQKDQKNQYQFITKMNKMKSEFYKNQYKIV